MSPLEQLLTQGRKHGFRVVHIAPEQKKLANALGLAELLGAPPDGTVTGLARTIAENSIDPDHSDLRIGLDTINQLRDAVYEACSKIVQERGRPPSYREVRDAVGGKSFSTLQPYIMAWRIRNKVQAARPKMSKEVDPLLAPILEHIEAKALDRLEPLAKAEAGRARDVAARAIKRARLATKRMRGTLYGYQIQLADREAKLKASEDARAELARRFDALQEQQTILLSRLETMAVEQLKMNGQISAGLKVSTVKMDFLADNTGSLKAHILALNEAGAAQTEKIATLVNGVEGSIVSIRNALARQHQHGRRPSRTATMSRKAVRNRSPN